jgi:hypothetical protein
MKAIFFILALKILTIENRYYRRTVFWCIQLTFVVIFFKNAFFSYGLEYPNVEVARF